MSNSVTSITCLVVGGGWCLVIAWKRVSLSALQKSAENVFFLDVNSSSSDSFPGKNTDRGSYTSAHVFIEFIKGVGKKR